MAGSRANIFSSLWFTNQTILSTAANFAFHDPVTSSLHTMWLGACPLWWWADIPF